MSLCLQSKIGTLAALVVLVACSTDDSSPEPPRGPEDLKVTRIALPGSAEQATESGDRLTVDCDTPLLVAFEPEVKDGKLGDFVIAPPGACDNRECGQVVIVVDPPKLVDAGVVTPSADREYPALKSPVRVDLPLSEREGTHVFRVELRDAYGGTVYRPDGTVLGKGLEIELGLRDPTCPPPSNGEGGAGGGAGAPSDAAGSSGAAGEAP